MTSGVADDHCCPVTVTTAGILLVTACLSIVVTIDWPLKGGGGGGRGGDTWDLDGTACPSTSTLIPHSPALLPHSPRIQFYLISCLTMTTTIRTHTCHTVLPMKDITVYHTPIAHTAAHPLPRLLRSVNR